MTIERDIVTREGVIRFYVAYDWRKKHGEIPPFDLDTWPWDDPDGLDRKLDENGLKKGVPAAYRTWKLVKLGVVDLLECAVYNGIFPRKPQVLCQLALLGMLAEWLPVGDPEWWRSIGNGSELGVEQALMIRPALKSEAPARWYVEDGSGRALALLQRILRYGEVGRTAWAYLGEEPDEQSAFIKLRPELKTRN